MLKDCKQCGFPWPKLDDGRCGPCVTKAKWAKDKDVARDATAAERARVVAIAREMAAEHDREAERYAKPGYGPGSASHVGARDALLALVERVER